jgi:Kef-type K+ transport system membrane component KefB
MIAVTGQVDLARLLLDLLVVLVAAKLAAEVCDRIRVPAVLGEILAGILIGPSVLHLVELGGDRGVSIAVLAELGVLLLLVSVGMEMDLGELGKVGGAAMTVAVIGVVVPFAAGIGVALAFGTTTNTAVFLGAALTATSVGITARVLGDLRALATLEARIVLGAAVADDVLGLVILTVVVKLVTGDSVGIGTVASTLGIAIAFLAITGVAGVMGVPRLWRALATRISATTLTVVSFALMIAFAALADVANLAFIIGAFVAGLALGRTDQHARIAADFGSVSHILVPVFFVGIGIDADLGAMTDPAVLGLAATLTAVAVVGKLVAGVGVRRRADRVLIGIGMIPRGEVGLIFAAIGLSNAVLDDEQYGALLIVILLTTVMTPPLLRWRLNTSSADERSDSSSRDDEPPEGWLGIDDIDGRRRVRLHGNPPDDRFVPLALGAARLAADADPSDELLAWFAARRHVVPTWQQDDAAALVEVLRHPHPRSWRFLEATGVLAAALPEVDDAFRQRRSDLSDLDPLGSFRFSPSALLGDEEDPVVWLAAFAATFTTRHDELVALAARLVPPGSAERLVAVVEDARLLARRALDVSAIDDRDVLQLATHVADADHVRRVRATALATQGLNDDSEVRLDALTERIVDALAHPELLGGEASDLAGARLAAALRTVEDPAVRDRLTASPPTHLLAHDVDALVRQATLVEPAPRPGTARAAVTPLTEADHWQVELVCRDVDGVLARMADVLFERGLDVLSADVATWGDGSVLGAFVVRSAERPPAAELGQELARHLSGRLRTTVSGDVEVTFDDEALPWHTVCIATGPDRPGAFRAVAHAFARAGIVVHSAHLATVDGSVVDRFAVTDRRGRRLDATAHARVRATLRG